LPPLPTSVLPCLAAIALSLPLQADVTRIWQNHSGSTFRIKLLPSKDRPEKGNMWFSRKVGETPDPGGSGKKIPVWQEFGVLGERTASSSRPSEQAVLWAPGEVLQVEFTHTMAAFRHTFAIENFDANQKEDTSQFILQMDQGITSRNMTILPWRKDDEGPKDAKGTLIYSLNSPQDGCVTINAHMSAAKHGKKEDEQYQKQEKEAETAKNDDWALAGMDRTRTYTQADCKAIWRDFNKKKHPDKSGHGEGTPEYEKATEDYNQIKLAMGRIFKALGYPDIIR